MSWRYACSIHAVLLSTVFAASVVWESRHNGGLTGAIKECWLFDWWVWQWWDDLWLNEGFAAWMQNFAADHLFPQWSLWEQFVYGDQGSALKLDALRSSHPIQVPIKHAEEVEEVFDLISYNKGACVIR